MSAYSVEAVTGRRIWIHTDCDSPDPFKPGNTMRATAEATMHSAIRRVSRFLELT